jgi:hypothetical protein
MAPVRSLLLRLTALAALLGTAAAVKHEEAPVVTVNGTLSEHFTAHVTEVQPGACVIFEAQVWLVPLCLDASMRPSSTVSVSTI